MATRLGENADRCRPPGRRQVRRREAGGGRRALPPAGGVARRREAGGGRREAGGGRREAGVASGGMRCAAAQGRRRREAAGRIGVPGRLNARASRAAGVPGPRGRAISTGPAGRDPLLVSRAGVAAYRPKADLAALRDLVRAPQRAAVPRLDGVDDRLGRGPCAAVPAELGEGSSSNRRALAVRPARP